MMPFCAFLCVIFACLQQTASFCACQCKIIVSFDNLTQKKKRKTTYHSIKRLRRSNATRKQKSFRTCIKITTFLLSIHRIIAVSVLLAQVHHFIQRESERSIVYVAFELPILGVGRFVQRHSLGFSEYSCITSTDSIRFDLPEHTLPLNSILRYLSTLW